MPQQISKHLAITLFDDEVEAFFVLEKFIKKRRLKAPQQFGNLPPTAKLVVRDILQFAAEHLKDEIGPEVAIKLSGPPALPAFTIRRAAQQVARLKSSKANGKTAKSKSEKKTVEKPNHRTVWNRPRRSNDGVTE